MNMDLRHSALLLLSGFMAAACGGEKKSEGTALPDSDAISMEQKVAGDSTLYGLACDGCTDSIVVILPNQGGDPDTFDIINANLRHQVFGKPRIGDQLAVIINPEDSAEALRVIDMEDLRSHWCYQILPHMRDISKMPKRLQRRMVAEMPDSEKQALMVPREVGYQLKRGYSIRITGIMPQANTTDDQSMVEYPPIARYKEWRLFNGRLILTSKIRHFKENEDGEVISEEQQPQVVNDTVELVLLQKDSLVLRFKDRIQGFYRKQ